MARGTCCTGGPVNHVVNWMERMYPHYSITGCNICLLHDVENHDVNIEMNPANSFENSKLDGRCYYGGYLSLMGGPRIEAMNWRGQCKHSSTLEFNVREPINKW